VGICKVRKPDRDVSEVAISTSSVLQHYPYLSLWLSITRFSGLLHTIFPSRALRSALWFFGEA